MTATAALNTRPAFMNDWPTAFPRHAGPWTVVGHGHTWGALDPEMGTISVVDPRRDPKLPALASALRRGNLIGYRVGRRAVVATEDSFIKVVRPRRLEALIDTHGALAASGPTLSIPPVLAHDKSGWVELARVPGSSLHQLIRSPEPRPALLDALDHIGAELAVFHSIMPPANLSVRKLDNPSEWIKTVSRAEPEAAAELARVARDLPAMPSARNTVVHGDLHDKNVFVSPSGVSLIDLDGVGLGAAEDDMANLAVHLRLRALQAGHQSCVGNEHAQRLCSTYRSVRTLDQDRLEAAERHTWFRLACLYRFRAASRSLTPELLRRATGRPG